MKDLNKELKELVYSQMWLNHFMDDCHLKKHSKNEEKKPVVHNRIERLKICNSLKNEHKFYIMKITLLNT